MTERKIKKRIFKMLRPLIQAPDISGKLKGKEDEETILELEYQHFFESTDELERSDPIYKVQIYNNCRVDPGIIYSSRKECEFCKKEHKDNCDFSFSNKNVCLKDVIRFMDATRNLVLVVNWRNTNPRAHIQLLEKNHQIEIDLSS